MVIDFRKLNKATRKDHLCLLLIKCLKDYLSTHTFVFSMDILVFLKYRFHNLVKRKPPLLVLLELMLIGACLLVYAVHLLPFKDVWLLYSMIFLKRLFRFHGWFLCLWNLLWWLLKQPWLSFAEMWTNKSCLEFRELPLYG